MENEISLFIDKPCYKQWSEMQDVEGGKFCSHCNKTVFDFTYFTNKDLIEYFSNGDKRVCGKFNTEQLNTNLLEDKKKGIEHFEKYQVGFEGVSYGYKKANVTQEKIVKQFNVDEEEDF